MATAALPEEQLSAYERWEMASFTDAPQSNARKLSPKAPANQSGQQTVNDVLESVRQEAYEKGKQEGYAVGMAQAKEHALVEREQFKSLMAGFQQALAQADEAISEDVLRLALDLAKAMAKTNLNVNKEVLLPVVADAINYLPHIQKPARIIVHHEDAAILRRYLADDLATQDWQVVEDQQIEQGGCLVETGANQIDASNAVRWKRITEALSQHNDWLLP